MSKAAYSPKMNSIPKDQLAAFSYVLYLYREELRKPRQTWMNRARSKFLLTHELVNKTLKNMHKCSHEDLQFLAREKEFKNNLFKQITRSKQQNNIQVQQNKKRPNEKWQQEKQKHLQTQQQHHLPQQLGPKKMQQQLQYPLQQQQYQCPQQYQLKQYQHQPKYPLQQKYPWQQKYPLQQQCQQQQYHYQQQSYQPQQHYWYQQAKRPCYNNYRTSSTSWQYS